MKVKEMRNEFGIFQHLNHINRFHKLVWGSYGMADDVAPNGVLCAGGDNGNVYVYNPSRLMNNDGDALMQKLEEHSGNIAALDVNPFQVSLF